MVFPYKHVLLIGATAGIGKGMAERLIKAGIKDRLDAFAREHGERKAQSLVFDITKTEETPKFAADVMSTSPDIDCIFFNAGVQGQYDFSQPEKVDFAKFAAEFTVNFTSCVALVVAFLPLLAKEKFKAGLIFTGTHLAIIPASSLSAYSASKAALNSFILCLRDQLRNTNVDVIEIFPPVVQTELHDYMGKEVGRNMGMPLNLFTEEVFKGLSSGSDQIIIGNIGPGAGIIPREEFLALVDKRRSAFTALVKVMRGEK
ncbi:Acylglycerone-phosphate reductase [Hyphodiscus hymeniophilus]|uniref:Acylglycerone-phosphate reductase n=1 Tax=Hyphodiscus hymeniophilus TaxID=353542 RepID=A0A9P7AY32_9HELO|nr:Acylglycerone-phosphate reductase [Hyphodiscus hymeniophilus]